jgi:archaeal flagellar protein FlaJ
MKHIPLLFIQNDFFSRPFRGIAARIANVFSNVKYDIEQADIDTDIVDYFSKILVNIFAFFIFFLSLIFSLNYFIQGQEFKPSILNALLYSFVILSLLFIVYIRYPKIAAGKKAEQLDRHLIFALKDLMLQISSGVSLYSGLVNVSRSGYGIVSEEFTKISKLVNAGMPIERALESMALKTSSEFFRRTVWQLINTIRAGASVQGALKSIVTDLTIEQTSKIRDYARELNLWSLIYMMFAVAVPTMGATLLVILASFAGAGISKTMFIAFLGINFALQYIIIGFVKSRRPIVNL